MTSGHLISGHGRIWAYPISVFEMTGRRQPTWRDAPPAARGDVEQNACYAAARLFAVRRPAGEVHDCLSIAAPLAPQLCPVFQALADFAFKAALGRMVELPAAERLGEIVLAGEGLLAIVVVFVAGAIAFGFHQLGRRVEDVLGRQE